MEPRGYFFWLLVVSALSFGLERLFTWRTKQPVLRRDLLQDIFWLVFNGHFAGVLIAIPAARAVEEIAALFGLVGLAEPASIAWLGAAPLAVQFVVVLVLKDFLEWSIHRL
ncbi:MAG: hypothetical protein RL846_26200, partial [Deltaproteobacteria bacterium]